MSCTYLAHHELESLFLIVIIIIIITTIIIISIITGIITVIIIIIKLPLLAQHRPFDDAESFSSHGFALTVTVLPSPFRFCPHRYGFALAVMVLPSPQRLRACALNNPTSGTSIL